MGSLDVCGSQKKNKHQEVYSYEKSYEAPNDILPNKSRSAYAKENINRPKCYK